jgi:hypothetical protein
MVRSSGVFPASLLAGPEVASLGKPDVSVSASDCEILRRAFIESVIEEGIPENLWRAHAALWQLLYRQERCRFRLAGMGCAVSCTPRPFELRPRALTDYLTAHGQSETHALDYTGGAGRGRHLSVGRAGRNRLVIAILTREDERRVPDRPATGTARPALGAGKG